MAITGNKGEWSEVYTLLKLLGDGVLYAGDEHLQHLSDLFYPIIAILRDEIQYNVLPKQIVVIDGSEQEISHLPMTLFLTKAKELLENIKDNTGTFSIPTIEKFMHDISCHTLKASSSDKTDIHIILHDQRTAINSLMGFSIKSQLGGHTTLLNASMATNFTFKICGTTFTPQEVKQINILSTKNKVQERFHAISGKRGYLTLVGIDNPTFARNIRMLDGDLQTILAEMLLIQLSDEIGDIPSLTQLISDKNPLHVIDDNLLQIYSYKIKQFLVAIALGMMPSKPWTGIFQANGGYIVVREDGEIVCYHFYDRNRFEDYLYNNTYLERSSTTRHQYAQIIPETDGTFTFKLNLQIRIK